jgi:tetratricopeptide (TPR) repeat protein
MKTLSLCMIVRNEAEMLPGFLTACKGLYDELCVVDTGSTDDTLRILSEAGAKVVQMEWQEDFAAARNRSLAMATSSHILVLDADEVVSEDFVGEMRSLLERPDIGAVCVNMVNALPHGHRSRSVLLRMFLNEPGIVYRHPIHEDASSSVGDMLRRVDKALGTMKSDVYHHGYSAKRAQERDKKVRDTTILWRCVEANPHDLYSWYKLLEQGRFWADPMLTEQAAQGAGAALGQLEAVPQASQHFLGEMVVLLAIAMRESDPDQAATLLHTWCERLPDDAAITLYRGTWREELGALDLARMDFLHCLQLRSYTPNLQLTSVRPRLGLARIAMAQGDNTQALDHAEAALLSQPRDPEALLAIASLSRLLGGATAAQRMAQAYLDTYGDCAELHAAFGEAALMDNAPNEAVRNLEVACATSERPDDYSALLERARTASEFTLL